VGVVVVDKGFGSTAVLVLNFAKRFKYNIAVINESLTLLYPRDWTQVRQLTAFQQLADWASPQTIA
jgi:hypothetical protein